MEDLISILYLVLGTTLILPQLVLDQEPSSLTRMGRQAELRDGLHQLVAERTAAQTVANARNVRPNRPRSPSRLES